MLGPHLARLTSIQQLDLSYNKIGAQGATSLGPHLARLTRIQQLDLSSNEIGAEGVRSLGPHLARLASMQKLHISCNNFPFVNGVKLLRTHLDHLTSLRRIF